MKKDSECQLNLDRRKMGTYTNCIFIFLYLVILHLPEAEVAAV